MTQTDTGTPVIPPARADVPAPETGPAPARTAQGPRRAGQHPWVVGAATLGLALLFAIGFFVYLFGLSGLTESRAQTTMFKNFVNQLQSATAPVQPYTSGPNGAQTPMADRTPVAVLNIPELGLRDAVVVEGTTSRDLALGPGHVPSSALPGQTGMSFIYGKADTAGAPFAHLMRLNRGEKFTVTTGQGTATYEVMSFGTSSKPAPVDSANRLVLETAAAGLWPRSAVQVSADLVSKPAVNPGNWPAIPKEDSYLAGDVSDGIIPLMLWSQALLLAVIIATIATYRWSRWPTYLVMAPVILGLTWCVYENLAVLLPNLY